MFRERASADKPFRRIKDEGVDNGNGIPLQEGACLFSLLIGEL
jgi:hypothetical protein